MSPPTVKAGDWIITRWPHKPNKPRRKPVRVQRLGNGCVYYDNPARNRGVGRIDLKDVIATAPDIYVALEMIKRLESVGP
jgi:hypothetical protein